MSGLTVCPACHSVFRVDDTQLAAAGGWAQCGVCGEAFDARAALQSHAANAEPVEVAAAPVDTPPPDEAPIHLDVPLADVAPVAPVEPFDPYPAPDAPEFTAPPRNPEPPSTPRAEPAGVTPPPAAVPRAARKPRAPRRTRWGALAAVLLVLLGLQSAWFLREPIVTLWPASRPLYTEACQALGCTPALPRRVDALRIVGSALQVGGSDGRFRLSLTLGNRAREAIAWPGLRVSLLDQNQRVVARRVFAPADYAPDPASIAAGLPAGSETASVLELAIHPPAPAGYRLELTN